MQSRLLIRLQRFCRPDSCIGNGRLLGTVLLIGFALACELPAQVPVEGVVRIDVGGVVARDLIVLFNADSLYLPIDETAALLGLELVTGEEGKTMLAVGGKPLLTFDSLMAVQPTHDGGAEEAIRFSGFRVHNGTPYVESGLLLGLLEVRGTFDFDHLLLRLVADERIPVVAWSRRKQIETIDGLTAELHATDRPAPYHRMLLGPPELYWRLSHDAYRPEGSHFVNEASATLALSTPLLFGRLDLGTTTRLTPGGERQVDGRLTHWRWTYSDPYGKLLTSLQAGSAVVADRPVTGFSLTNRALGIRRLPAIVTYRGTAPPGSIVEIFRDRSGSTTVTADSTGHFALGVPVSYGTTRVLLRSGEPDEERRDRQITWHPADRILPTGTVEYRLGVGITRDGGGDVAADLSLRGGISTRWTVEGIGSGIVVTDGSERSLQDAEALIGVVGWLGRSSEIRVGFDLPSQTARGSLLLGSQSEPGLSLLVDSAGLDGRTDLSASFRLPFGSVRIDGGSRLFSDGEGIIDAAPFGSFRAGFGNSSVALSAALPLRSRNRTERDLALGLDLTAFACRWLPVGAGIRWYRDRLIASECYLRASAHLRRTIVEAGATIPFESPRDARYSLQIELPIGGVRPVLRATTGNGLTGLSTTVEGMTLASSHGIRTLPVALRGGTSILLAGFEDQNLNGVWDPGERSLGNLEGELHAEGRSDRFIEGRIDGYAPFRPVTVEVNRFSHAGLGLFPTRSRYDLTTGPGYQITLDVPFAPGRDLLGSVRIEDGGMLRTGPLLTALTAWLTSEGGSRSEGEVFSDGTLYFAGLPQGRYHLSFDPRQLSSRGLCMVEESPVVVIGGETERIGEVVLRLCRR